MGKLRLVLSDWDKETQAWQLPKLPGLSVEAVLSSSVHVSPEKWALDSSNGAQVLRWKSDGEPPKDPLVVVWFREPSLRTKLLDPAFLTPMLLFLGTLTGALFAYQTGRFTSSANIEVAKVQSHVEQLVTQAKALNCDNKLDGTAAVSACLDVLKVGKESTEQLRTQLDQKTKDLGELQVKYNKLQVAYNKLRVAWQKP